MDPITAVSFAASALTFIDVGYKIVTGTLELLQAKAEEWIDELFFGPNDIKKAFTDLITRSTQRGCRFCLFKDSLANPGQLRPYRQFEDTFSDEQRIRLHELARFDIVLAGRQMFEKDRSSQRPQVQACYVDLVDKVADASHGVLSWASLAMRSLLKAIARYDPIDSLKQHLQAITRDLSKLYKRISHVH
ncbi:hypothetical protein N657DRAFT_684267 [Parathielavia appendiculata]|uniref:Uncharacterized protein n=1 Tax=Parathielavia appendiculata TaxID=2587402 RepID=A0AAN6YZ95_9PEZI|nr:hypothetical protein N657DRAFT_684267 [Parathielavia appendiculata]